MYLWARYSRQAQALSFLLQAKLFLQNLIASDFSLDQLNFQVQSSLSSAFFCSVARHPADIYIPTTVQSKIRRPYGELSYKSIPLSIPLVWYIPSQKAYP
ncbi:hypothetical protein BDW71DRAFT_176017 [Aspergillus fruticulosus]